MLKGFVTQDNVYYESMGKLNPTDIEVPLRRPQNVTPPLVTPPQQPQPPYWYPQAPAANAPTPQAQPKEEKGMFGNVGWKDVITFIYFLSGIAALWINMSERTLIMEQRQNSAEKEISTLRETVKELNGRGDAQYREAEKRISELRYDMLKHGRKD